MTENAYTLLRLEQRLESCRRVHQEELDEIRRAIIELRNQILFNCPAPGAGPKRKQEHNPLTNKGDNLADFNGNQDDGI